MDVLTKRRCWKVLYLFIPPQSVICLFLSLVLIFIVMYHIEQDQQRASVRGFHQHIPAICQCWHFRTHLSSGLIWLDWVSKLPVSQLAANRVEPRKTSFLQNVLLLFQLESQCVIIDIKSVFLSSGLNSIMCINNHIKLASFLITGIMNETFSFRQNLEGFWAHNSLSISMIYILSVTQLLLLVLGRPSDLCRSQLNHRRDLKATPVGDEQAQDRPSQSPFVLAGCWDMLLVMLGHSSYGRWWSR